MVIWKSKAKELDGTLDPIRCSDLRGKASCAILFFFERFLDPKCEKPTHCSFLKHPGGQVPKDRDYMLTHLIARDSMAFGVEYYYHNKKDYFFGRGYINWCLSEFIDIAERSGLLCCFADNSIHIGEVVTYISYSYMYGDMQTLMQCMHQLKRRKNKVLSNLRVKSSQHDEGKKTIINVTPKGWFALTNSAYVPPVQKKNYFKEEGVPQNRTDYKKKSKKNNSYPRGQRN